MGVSADTPTAATGAMAEEEEEVEDDGKTRALAKGGMTSLARTAGRTSLAKVLGGISLARTVLGAMLGFPLYGRSSRMSTSTSRLISRLEVALASPKP